MSPDVPKKIVRTVNLGYALRLRRRGSMPHNGGKVTQYQLCWVNVRAAPSDASEFLWTDLWVKTDTQENELAEVTKMLTESFVAALGTLQPTTWEPEWKGGGV